MISGALFLSISSSIKKIFKKNIMKIGISYFFWSLVYCIKLKFIKNIKLYDFNYKIYNWSLSFMVFNFTYTIIYDCTLFIIIN